MRYDVAIIGGGPAGSSCAAFCAAHGLRAIVIEREKFPREKVCGDCLNPASWLVLKELELDDRIRALPHARLDWVEFIALTGERLEVELQRGASAEIAIKRSALDFLLLQRAAELGAEIREATVLTALNKSDAGWKLFTTGDELEARILVGADGRNSSVARLLASLPRAKRDRVALQAHVPLPPSFGHRVVLQFLPGGYCGQAPVNDRELNVCLVGRAQALPELRGWAAKRFGLAGDQQWRTITPLARRSIAASGQDVFFIGDAARVVEPFTGEGIFYAMASGKIAAATINRITTGTSPIAAEAAYRQGLASMYRGRLWINVLARAAVISPAVGSFLFRLAKREPALLRQLTKAIAH